MRVALIQPNSPYLTYPLAFPSLGLLYISAHLKANGYETEYFDLTGCDDKSFPMLVQFPELRADVIAFSCQITQYKEVLRLRHMLKKNNPDAKFVIGGPFPTHSPGICLRDNFFVIQGEGEIPMLQFLQGIEEPYKHVDPNFFPDWNAIDLQRYGYGLEGKRCINIMTKRGNCPYNCGFCAKTELGRSPLRFRTVANVLAECAYLKGRGFGAIAIYDDDVLINKKRDYEIFDGLKNLGMPYRCMTRTDLANWDDLVKLKETGCAEVAIGVETADEEIRLTIKKGTTLKQDTLFVQIAKEIGLRVKAYLMIGLPGETRRTVYKTLAWLRKNKPDNFDISIFTPYPGSHIYKHKMDYQIDWDQEVLQDIWFSGEAQYGSCAVRTPKLSSVEILELKELFQRKEGGSTTYWKPL